MTQLTPIDDLRPGDTIEIVQTDGRTFVGHYLRKISPRPGVLFVQISMELNGQPITSCHCTRNIETLRRSRRASVELDPC